MVSRTRVAKQVRQAFEPARQELSTAQSQSQERLRQQARTIEARRQQLQSQQAIRGIGLQERQRLGQALSSAEQSLEQRVQQTSLAFSSAREQLQSQQFQTIEREVERASRFEQAFFENEIRKSIIGLEKDVGSLSAQVKADIRSRIIESGAGETVDISDILATGLPSVAGRVQIQPPSRPSIQPATLGERVRGGIRETTGISIPSARGAFGLFARGIEPGELQPEITTFDIAAAPATIFLRGVGETGRLVGEGLVEPGLERLGFEGFQIAPEEIIFSEPTITLPSLGERIRGRIRETTGISIPGARGTVAFFEGEEELPTRIVTPGRVGAVSRFGTEVALLGAAGRVGAGGAFVLEGTRTAFDPRESFERRLFGGAGAVLGGALLGSAGARALTRPRTIFTQPIPSPSVRVIREQVPVTLPSGRVVFQERFRQVAVQPARFETRASILQQLRGEIPLDPTQISRRAVFRARDLPEVPILLDEGGNILLGGFATRREGARLTSIFGLGGGGREFSLSELQGLSATQRLALQRGVGGQTGGLIGVPEDVRFLSGGIETTRAFRITSNPSTKTITVTFPPLGRTTRRFETVTATRPVPGLPNVFQVVSGAGETTFGGTARRIIRVEGALKIKQPTIIDSPGASRILTGKRPTFTKQVQEEALQLRAVTGENIQSAVTRVLEQKAKSGALSRAVSKPPVRTSSLGVGLGILQEQPAIVTSETVAPPFQLPTTQVTTIQPSQVTPQVSLLQLPALAQVPRQALVQPLGLEVTQQEKLSIKQRAKQLISLAQQSRTKQIATLGITSPQALSQRQRTSQVERLFLRQLQAQKLRNLITSTGITPTSGRPRPPIRPPTPPPIVVPLPKGELNVVLRSALRKLGAQSFDVVVGRGKKAKTIASSLPQFRALRRGADSISKNITASFKLVASNKLPTQPDIKPFNLGRKFRLGKRDKTSIVEKRGFRLDSKSELAQISSARRRKRK